jgi:hypothetical protein
MGTEHRARITWSADQLRVGLPNVTQTIDPSWFLGDRAAGKDGWSLVCVFTDPPRAQGNPSIARIQFLTPEAPHGRLKPGTTLELFERGTQQRATVEVLE